MFASPAPLITTPTGLRLLLLPAGSGIGVSYNERSFEGLLESALSRRDFLPLERSSVLISCLELPWPSFQWPEDGAERKSMLPWGAAGPSPPPDFPPLRETSPARDVASEGSPRAT